MAQMASNFTVDEFLKKIPDRDPAGHEIPMWKRQMLAKKAADKAKRETEETIKRQIEEMKAKAIPEWKRHLRKREESAYIR